FGAVTITQSVSIIAAPGAYAGITLLSGNAITINAGGSDVVILRGLTLNGQAFATNGVVFNTGGSLHVEDSSLLGFQGFYGIRMAGAGTLHMKNVLIRSCGTALRIDNASGTTIASLQKSHLDGNTPGFSSAPTPPPRSK